MHRFFPSSFYNFELTRLLGTAPGGGSGVAEFLEVVGKLPKHDAESWYREWHARAEKAQRQGKEAAERQHSEFARKAFLRASSYFRAAAYMLFTPDPRILQCSERSIENFKNATPFLDGVEVITLDIPFEDKYSLPGYLLLPPPSKRLPGNSKTPVLLNCGGADSTKEELYFILGSSAPSRLCSPSFRRPRPGHRAQAGPNHHAL